RLTRIVLVEIGATGQPVSELTEPRVLAAPVVAHAVAKFAVPLRPNWREIADLVAAFADVPGLGDQLDPAHDRILLNQIEKRRQPIDCGEVAAQRGRHNSAKTLEWL